MSSNETLNKPPLKANNRYQFNHIDVAVAMTTLDIDCSADLREGAKDGPASRMLDVMNMENSRKVRQALGRFMRREHFSQKLDKNGNTN